MTQQIPEFILHDFEPAYMQMYRRGELGERVEQALQELEDCCACPRGCRRPGSGLPRRIAPAG